MDGSSSSSSSPESSSLKQLCIPRDYKVLKVLGEGGFGRVVKCVKRSTKEVVAVKVSVTNYDEDLRNEASMLRELMSHNLHQHNIIRFHGEVILYKQMSLVFEMLDMSLYDYVMDLDGPMRLEDIRSIIQQLAIALDALKGIGVIHADVKLDNIMVVDHTSQPIRVKLIDFGLAVFRSKVKQGQMLQTPYYRAPEIMLGSPFTEAIDVFSLGCVMGILVYGCLLFPARLNYDALQFMTELLGPAPQHLIEAGLKSQLYYKRDDSNQLILMRPEEYWDHFSEFTDNRSYTFRSLDETILMRHEPDNVWEPEERRESIELLKAMLTWDEQERITPAAIRNHAFITKSYLSSSSHFSPCTTLPSRVILVRPAPPGNRIPLQETPHENKEDVPPTTTVDHKDLKEQEEQELDQRDQKEMHLEETDQMKVTKEKKKKSRFKRFCSWIRKTVRSCCSVDNVVE